MLIETILLLGAIWTVKVTIDHFSQPQTGLSRLGQDPGPLKLRTWWARWKWYKYGHTTIVQAYQKSKNTNFVIQTLMGDTVVLAPKFLNELNMLPESKLSATAALVDSVMGTYSGVDILLQGHVTSDICRGPLVKNLPHFLPLMAEELQLALNELGDRIAQGLAAFTAYELLFSLIHRITSRVFVGRAFCYNSIWNDAVTALPVDVEITKFIRLPFPDSIRRFVAPLIPQRNRIFRHRAAVRDLLLPPSEDITVKEEPSVLKLLLLSGKDMNPDTIAARLLLLTAAALHTSSMASTQAIYDLCTMPEYAGALRSEARDVLSQDSGEWKMSTVKNLRQLDSFLKESQRLNQATFLGFDRKVMSPIELSDGKTVLHPGATIVMPGGPMARDPSFYDHPLQFDGRRFYRPDESEETGQRASTHDFTGIEPGNLSWGNGRFTCPGRWYAATMIKLILASLLLEYDISFPEGQVRRPQNSKYDTEIHPDFEQKILLSKRPSP